MPEATDLAALYKLGAALALFTDILPGGVSQASLNKAVEEPAKSLEQLKARAANVNDKPELKKQLEEILAELPALPEQLNVPDQGQVMLGYYNMQKKLHD